MKIKKESDNFWLFIALDLLKKKKWLDFVLNASVMKHGNCKWRECTLRCESVFCTLFSVGFLDYVQYFCYILKSIAFT